MSDWIPDRPLDAWIRNRRDAIDSAKRAGTTTMRCALHMGAFDEPMWLVPETEWAQDAPTGTLRVWVCGHRECRTAVAEVRG